MTDPALPTYDAVRAARTAWLRDRDRQYRHESRGIPTAEQRVAWVAEFDAWTDAIRAEAWDDGYAEGGRGRLWDSTNPYRED